MASEQVQSAYAQRAAEYIELFGSIDDAAEGDRHEVLTWARSVDGPVVDVGCGPGQWSGFLARHGVDIRGVDPVPVFVDEARRRHPDIEFRVGRAEHLDADDASLGGVLAWYSLIHLAPDDIDDALSEFARCTRTNGGLAVGFFEGPTLAPFDHAVTSAYCWPVADLAGRVERAGFDVVDTQTRTEPGARRHGMILARRRA